MDVRVDQAGKYRAVAGVDRFGSPETRHQVVGGAHSSDTLPVHGHCAVGDIAHPAASHREQVRVGDECVDVFYCHSASRSVLWPNDTLHGKVWTAVPLNSCTVVTAWMDGWSRRWTESSQLCYQTKPMHPVPPAMRDAGAGWLARKVKPPYSSTVWPNRLSRRCAGMHIGTRAGLGKSGGLTPTQLASPVACTRTRQRHVRWVYGSDSWVLASSACERRAIVI